VVEEAEARGEEGEEHLLLVEEVDPVEGLEGAAEVAEEALEAGEGERGEVAEHLVRLAGGGRAVAPGQADEPVQVPGERAH
jgi:hypothetical protein